MTRQIIPLGQTASDGVDDQQIRIAGSRMNANFAELYGNAYGSGISLNNAGVFTDGVTPSAALLETAIEAARLGGYTLIAKPTDAIFMERGITINENAFVNFNGAKLDFSSLTNSTGFAVTIQGNGGKKGNISGLNIVGPTTGSLDGVVFTGTSSLNLAYQVYSDMQVTNFRDGVCFGGYVFLVQFNNPKIIKQHRYGWNFSFGATAGENIRIVGGETSNVRSGDGFFSGVAIYSGTNSGSAVQFIGHSTDYSDSLIKMVAGCITYTDGHLEADGANPYGLLDATSGTPHLSIQNTYMYQPGDLINPGGNPEALGGRPSMFTLTGGWAELIIDSVTWVYDDTTNGNYNTVLVTRTDSNLQKVHVSKLSFGRGRGSMTNVGASLGLGSPLIGQGNFTNGLSPWTVDTEVNCLGNSAFYGAVAGSPGTLPSYMAISGTGGGLTIAVSAIDYSGDVPKLRLRFYGTSDGTQPFLYLDQRVNACPTKQYDAWDLVIGAKLYAIVGTQLGFVLGTSERNSSDSSIQGYSNTYTLQTWRQSFKYSHTIAQSAAAYVRPYIALATPTSGTAIDMTIELDAPEFVIQNSPVTQKSAAMTTNPPATPVSPNGRIGISPTAGPSGGSALHMWGNGTSDFGPIYLSLAARTGDWVYVRGLVKFANYVSGGAGLKVEQLDNNGNVLYFSAISGAYLTSGSTTYSQHSDTMYVRDGVAAIRVRPWLAALNGEAYFANIEATII